MQLSWCTKKKSAISILYLTDGIPELSFWTCPCATKEYISEDCWDKLCAIGKPNLLNSLAYREQAKGQTVTAIELYNN